jgi:hypothetical protein
MCVFLNPDISLSEYWEEQLLICSPRLNSRISSFLNPLIPKSFVSELKPSCRREHSDEVIVKSKEHQEDDED